MLCREALFYLSVILTGIPFFFFNYKINNFMNLLTKASFRKEGNVYTHTETSMYIFYLSWFGVFILAY